MQCVQDTTHTFQPKHKLLSDWNVRDGLIMAIGQSFRISRMPILSSGEYFRLPFLENTKGVIHVRAHVTKYTSVHFAPTLEKWKMGKCRKCRALSVVGAGATFFLHPMKWSTKNSLSEHPTDPSWLNPLKPMNSPQSVCYLPAYSIQTAKSNPAASAKELDDNDVPFVNRDKCAAHYIAYYKCLNKGTSFCSTVKDQFYECQYVALKQRLEKHWFVRNIHIA